MLVLLVASLASLASAAVHTIDVGEGGMKFTPETLTNVRQGDTLIFHLYPQHDVVLGDFDTPCRAEEGGFYSGPFSETDNGKKRFVVNVTDDDPMYWYCSVEKHCQNGMVGGANLPSQGETLDAYKNSAKSVAQAETPQRIVGGQLQDERQVASVISTAGGSTATGSASTSGTASTETGASTTGTEPAAGTATDSTMSAPSSTATGAANVFAVGSTSMLSVVFAVFGWLL